MRDETSLASEVLERIPNKYLAVAAASKRARAINDGSRPLVKVGVAKPSTIAMEEIAAGHVVPETEELRIAAEEETQLLPTSDDVPEADADAETKASTKTETETAAAEE